MLFTDIYLWGLRLQEPGSIISDILLGMACIIFFYKLTNQKEHKQQKFIALFFLYLGISSFFAAFAHGFFYYFKIYLHIVSWFFSGLSIFYLQLGSANLFLKKKFKAAYLLFIKTQFFIYLVLIFTYSGFEIVKLNFVISMLGIITPIFLIDYFRNKYSFNFYVILGIFMAIIPSLYHKVNYEFGYIFNMNDLSHIFLILCIFFVFLGVQNRFYPFNKIKIV